MTASPSAVAILAAFCVFLAVIAQLPGDASAESKNIVVAELIPVPRPNPFRIPDDPIGALISGQTDGQAPAAGKDPTSQTMLAIEPPEPSNERSVIAEAAFNIAIRLFDLGDPKAALAASHALPDPIDAKVIKWLVAVHKSKTIPAGQLDEISRELADWPGQTLLRTKFEQALGRQKLSPDEIIAAFAGNQPVTDKGTLLLARAYLAAGQKSKAGALIRPRWREERLEDSFEKTIRKDFASILTKADHKFRMDRMLYAERTVKALRAAGPLDSDQKALAKAVITVIKRSKKALGALDALPKSLSKEPILVYSRIQALRRADRIDEAFKLMLSATRSAKALVDPDAWWVERKVLAREIMKLGDYRTAYRIVAAHSAQSSVKRAEAEFHAGWLALEFLDEPKKAARHFAVIRKISTMPLSQSRAEYWLARAAEAAGDDAEAKRQYRLAGDYATTFYGQLALAALGKTTLRLDTPRKPDAAARKRFAKLELVQVMLRLVEVKRDDRNSIFMRHLAKTLTDPTQLMLLTAMAEKEGNHNLALQLGKVAASRGLPVDTLAFPVAAIPKSAKTAGVDKAIVYAIARQESAFHPGAVSRAGARGLLQLMPGTAKQMARKAGVSYSKKKLTSDPGYNATLGAHYLEAMLERFNGSYVMTFAAYNAGPSRVDRWIKTYGDPRDPDVDVVNWVELIPFTETRNYVQRIMENQQVYRARLGSSALTIEADLKRGSQP
jgi:soluble lytic murein transglycosylase